MTRLIFTISVMTVCFLKAFCQLGGLKSKDGFCIIAGLIIQSSGLPMYDEMIDEYDEADGKYNNNMARTSMTIDDMHWPKPTLTTEAAPPNEWRLRREYQIKCIKEVKITPNKVISLLAGKVWKVNDKELKCWVLCILNKMSLMSKEGVFKLDVAMSKLQKEDRDEAEILIDHCLPKQNMEACEIAWRYVKCHHMLTQSPTAKNLTAISVF